MMCHFHQTDVLLHVLFVNLYFRNRSNHTMTYYVENVLFYILLETKTQMLAVVQHFSG